jgi:tyrosine-protein kinase
MAALDPLPADEAFRLREYLGVLRRRKYSIAIIAIMALGAALLYARQATPVYESTASVLATNPLQAVGANGAAAPVNMDTESQLVTSDNITKCAWVVLEQPTFKQDISGSTLDLDKLCAANVLLGIPLTGTPTSAPVLSSPAPTGTPSPSASASAAPAPTLTTAPPTSAVPPISLIKHATVGFSQTSTVLEVTYSDTNKVQAQAGAQAFALAYIQIKGVQARNTLAQLRSPLEAEKAENVTREASLNKQLNDVIAQIAANTANGIKSGGDLDRKASDIELQLQLVRTKLLDLSGQLSNLSDENILLPQLVLPGRLPIKPASPNKPLDAALGLFVGLAFGIGIAFLREKLDDGIRGRTDVEENLGTPVLAVIPKVPGWRKKQEPKLVTMEQPKSAVSEAYRTLRTSIQFAAVQRGLKMIAVTSAGAGEGKTTTAANLAVTLADANKRVILVSADLRKPRIHQFFKMSNERGVSSALIGEVKPWEALKDPQVENLRILTSGPIPARPAELLQSEQMGELLMELREVADFVIIDTAPVLLVADALALAPLVDGMLFVADAEATSRTALAHAREQLEQVDAPIIGCVFNNFDPSKAKSYAYGAYSVYRYRYRHHYGELPHGQPYDGEARRAPGFDLPQERRTPT